MAKLKTSFFCQSCGTNYAKWLGQCTSCKQWNTIVEEIIQKEEKQAWRSPSSEAKKKVQWTCLTLTQNNNKFLKKYFPDRMETVDTVETLKRK